MSAVDADLAFRIWVLLIDLNIRPCVLLSKCFRVQLVSLSRRFPKLVYKFIIGLLPEAHSVNLVFVDGVKHMFKVSTFD